MFNVFVPLRGGKALLYNTLHRGLSCLNPEQVQKYRSLEQNRLCGDAAETLSMSSQGFAVPADRDELLETQKLYGQSRFNDSHLQLVVAPTLGCNFACDYCYQGLDKKHGKMTEDTRQKVLDFIDTNHKNLQSLEVHWYGGEPLNDRQSIYALSDMLIKYSTERGLRFFASMVTNGYQLTGEVARDLEKRGLAWAQVTIDGAKSIHDTRRILLSGKGTYDKIIRNLKEIVAQTNIKIVLRCNVDNRNIDQAYDLVDDLAAQGFSNSNVTIYFAPVQTMTEECLSINEFVEGKRSYAEKELKLMRYAADRGLLKFDLPGVFNSICVGVKQNGWVIDPSGNFQKCFDTVQREDLKIGDLTQSPDELANSPYLMMWRSWTPFQLPTCRSCKLLPSCGGSCAYKFIHRDKTEGDDTQLPCPSLKFSIAERLFEFAIDQGLVTHADWDPEHSKTTPEMVGPSYTQPRLDAAIAAMDKDLEGFENRAANLLARAQSDTLPESVYAKLGRSKTSLADMAERRLNTSRDARALLKSR
ncbi:putative arylsulfatase regulator (Fe-S oxidoreductase) [Rhodobacteraceae bacterium KLH11]|nr:putative arylsulfatase regulator (Fe-S oxidoreductase) [Rhodobacteraceae bacterium KLH11]